MPRSKGRLTLPDHPNLEQLRQQAKERLVIIRSHAPEAQLSDAQFALARDYGFPGWRALKAEVEKRGGAWGGLIGDYAYDEAVMSNTVVSVTARGQRLFLERGRGVTTEILPQADGSFATPGLSISSRFECDAAGKARALIVETEAGTKVRVARISTEKAAAMRAARQQAAMSPVPVRTAIELSDEALARCAGRYASVLGEVIAFLHEDGKLLMGSPRGEKRGALEAESESDFFVPKTKVEFHFDLTDDGAASVITRIGGAETLMTRISPKEAERLGAAASRRMAEQAAPRQPVPVPAEILARYAGRYRIANGMEMAITVEEGRIFAQMLVPAISPSAKPPRQEIFPESESKFFWTAMPVQVSFFTDADGDVAYGVWHQGGYVISISPVEEPEAIVAPAA